MPWRACAARVTELRAAPELQSERLRLRAWHADDAGPFLAQYADAEASRFIGGPLSAELAWRKLASIVGHWQLRGFGIYALERRDGGDFVGACGLWFPEGWPQIEIGYWLRPAHHGNGYASEAVRAVRRHAQQDLGLTDLVSYVVDDNLASQRVAERCDCRLDGNLTLMGKQARVYRHPCS